MSGAVSAVAIDVQPGAPTGVLGELMLVRMAADNGATRADLVRDLAPLTSHRLSPSELRTGIDGALESLSADELISGNRGRFRLTDAGDACIAERLGARKLPPSWQAIRDARLTALALGLPAEPAIIKALGRPDGLRALILQRAFDVGGKRVLGSSRLRMALAVVALERAFGNKIKGGLDAGRGLSVKASRLLAGQLARRPRDFGTDTRLIASLAAEVIGASQGDPNSLRQAILRRYISERLGGVQVVQAAAAAIPAAAPIAEVAPAPIAPKLRKASQPLRPAAANRPDLEGFARIVLACADAKAEGWPGNRKALIAHVWQAIAEAQPDWGLSDIEFKSMLAEAHRTGHVILGSADIKNKENLKDVQASAIAYKNTVWHYIRVEN
ncbi:MAG: hypothetical protein ACR2PI_00565 [Hyphomicrobiaceae bacterium]